MFSPVRAGIVDFRGYPRWMATCRDIGAQIKNEDYRKLFVSAVNEYAREKRCWRSGYRLPGTITGKAAPWTPSWNPEGSRTADAGTIYSASIAGILLTFGEITLNKLPANECYA